MYQLVDGCNILEIYDLAVLNLRNTNQNKSLGMDIIYNG
jgi:hypothetical protein